MTQSKKPKGFTPSPFFTSWWGSLAERVWRVAPLKRKLSSRSEIPHKTQEDKTPEQKCPCEAFTMCDTYYQNMDPIVKDAWRFCVKKKGMSGYGLFMKECLCLLIAGYNFPEGCSVSGGYNCLSVEPGDEEPPLEGFIGQADIRWRCFGPPDWLCKPSPSGAYKTLEACQAVCHEPVENTCNACNPAIPDTLYVTYAGLGGTFSIFNGETPVYWLNTCSWVGGPGPWPAPPYMNLWWSAPRWNLNIVAGAAPCARWTLNFGEDPCDPTKWLYNFVQNCQDAACANPNSCALSVGATASVSTTPA